MPDSLHILKGIAPNANLLDLRVLDKNGASTDSAVIAAIQQAVQLKSKYNVRVINLSLGRAIYEGCNMDPLCRAAEVAWAKGIVVVTAAGNVGRNGYATILSPANSPHAITVGSMKTLATYPRTDDLIASYSSKGPTYIDLTVKPDLVAPGNLVVSTRNKCGRGAANSRPVAGRCLGGAGGCGVGRPRESVGQCSHFRHHGIVGILDRVATGVVEETC